MPCTVHPRHFIAVTLALASWLSALVFPVGKLTTATRAVWKMGAHYEWGPPLRSASPEIVQCSSG